MMAPLAVAFVTSCSRRAPSPDRVTRDPVEVPLRETSVPPNVVRSLAMIGGRVVDLDQRKVRHTLSADAPTFQAHDRRDAFIVDRAGKVRAYDLTTGARRFEVVPAHCQQFATTERTLHCLDGAGWSSVDKSTGTVRAVKPASTVPVAQIVGLGSTLIVLRGGGVLEAWEHGDTLVATIAAPLHAFPPLVARGDRVCGAAAITSAVFASCWSKTLVPLWSKSVSLISPGDPKHARGELRRLDADFLVATASDAGVPIRSVVLRIDDGKELARVSGDVAAAIMGAPGVLEALIAMRPTLAYRDPTGAVRWTSKAWGDSAAAVHAGDAVVVATWNRSSAGAQIAAYDRATGVERWKTAPKLPPIAHSAYVNEVELAWRTGALAMYGDEAAVEYLLLVEPSSGNPLLDVVVPRW